MATQHTPRSPTTRQFYGFGRLSDTHPILGLVKDIITWFDAQAPEALFLSVVTIGEIRQGIEQLRHRDTRQAQILNGWLLDLTRLYSDRVLAIDAAVADEWGRLRAIRSVPVVDAFVAATARVHGLTLVTRNERDFAGLRVTTVKVAPATLKAGGASAQGAVLNASGYVVARRRATVSSKVTGKVVDVLIEEGHPVKAGQILAHLDDTQPRASLALAEAQLSSSRKAAAEDQARLQQAELTLGRRQQLLKEGVVGKAELDQAQSDVDSLKARIAYTTQQIGVAESQVNLQQTNLTDMVVRAPFGGVVISKDAQPGEMISPNSAGGGFTRTGIGTIVDMSSLEVEVDVNETYINRVVNGMRVEAVLDAYQDWRIPAHVITTIPSADRQKATVKVRIGFDALDPRILPDMGVKVSFLRE